MKIRYQPDKCFNLLFFLAAILFFLMFLVVGCNPKASTKCEVCEFDRVGEILMGMDCFDCPTNGGPYRVVNGDILEFLLPVETRIVSSDLAKWKDGSIARREVESYYSRVNENGKITLPIIGRVQVVGKTMSEIEEQVIGAYYPKYIEHPPMIVCKVSEYKNQNRRVFSVLGLVNQPQTFTYPPDVEYNLLEAIAFAGGLNMVADPHYIKVLRKTKDKKVVSVVVEVGSPRKIANAANVTIRPGDVVYVDHTLRTRTNQFLSDVLQIRVGADVDVD